MIWFWLGLGLGLGLDWRLEVGGWKWGRKGVRPLDRWIDRYVGKSEWNEGCFTLFCFVSLVVVRF